MEFFLKKLLLITLLQFTVLFQGYSQCQDEIDKANLLFEEGRFREAEKKTKLVLETCELKKMQYDEMLKLMASIYYEMDEIELGDQYMSDFLKRNPFYIGNKKNDPVQFRQAIKKLKAYPRFSLTLKGGTFLGKLNTRKIFPILDTADYLQEYTIKPVFQGGVEVGYNLNSYFSITLESNLKIQKILHNVPQYDLIFFNYEEKNISTSFPLTLGFCFPQGNSFSAKIYSGAEIVLFTEASYSYFYTVEGNISSENSIYLNKKAENRKIEPIERNKIRLGAIGGLRVQYKIARFNVFTDIRYKKEFSLYNNPDYRFSDPDLFILNNYAIADIKQDYLDLSFGIVYHFFYKVKSKY